MKIVVFFCGAIEGIYSINGARNPFILGDRGVTTFVERAESAVAQHGAVGLIVANQLVVRHYAPEA